MRETDENSGGIQEQLIAFLDETRCYFGKCSFGGFFSVENLSFKVEC